MSPNQPQDDFRTPGHLIEHLLAEKGWSQRTLAIVLGVSDAVVSKLIAGTQALTPELAIALSELFDVPAEQFMDLQKTYSLAQARLQARPDPGRASRAHIFGKLPIAEMMKRGWLKGVDAIVNVPQVEGALRKFFRAESTEEIEIMPHAAKKTHVSREATPTQIAWLYRVRQIASEMLTARYSQEAVEAAVGKLLPLRESPDNVRKVPRILAEAGIRFLIVESLPGAKIDGVCFWLDESKPVIAMTLRYDRIDNFWFVLRHELEHVIRRHGLLEVIVDAELEGDSAGSGPTVSSEERLANEAAAEFCVPQRSMKAFIERKAPTFSERDLLGLARVLKIHPGLVAGQLQNYTKRFECFRKHLVKVRSQVTPGAIVDGWGDIYPAEQE